MSESSTTRQLQFVIRLGDLRKPLDAGSNYTIGKESNCDLRLGHASISPIHCRLQVTASEVIVHDLNSLCGTKINEQTVMDGRWIPGQILELGDIRLELETQALVVGPLPGRLISHRSDPSFGEVMATELKRTPWFAFSLFVHATVLLLMWLFSDYDVPVGSNGRTFALQESEEEQIYHDEEIQEEIVVEKEMQDEPFNETDVDDIEEEMFFDETDIPDNDNGLTDVNDLLTKILGPGLDDILKAGKGQLSKKFLDTTAEMRKNGLEIVFVFDSTASMSTVLRAAKERVEKMVSVMLELVPYARIGIITYRDSGPGEAYVTREVRLSRDLYRSINFLQIVYAAGGGDEPEAVYQALRAAFRQNWSPTARRLVILIGDAPPHKRHERRISDMVKSFARNGRSFVHAIITRPSSGSDIAKTTVRTFRRIARDGRGQALEFEDEGKILKAVMRLAFGRKESSSLDEVYRRAEGRNKLASKRSKRLVEKGGSRQVERLRKEFSRPVIEHDLIKAILLNPRREVLGELVEIMGDDRFNNAGKHAAAYVLTRALGLDEAPVNAENCRPISRGRVKTLKRLVEIKFN